MLMLSKQSESLAETWGNAENTLRNKVTISGLPGKLDGFLRGVGPYPLPNNHKIIEQDSLLCTVVC